MKPTKNRVYCYGAGRVKMLFQAESQAENFIKFNTKNMEEQGRKVPVRSYYCNMCGGWHVTSNPDAGKFEEGTYMERVIGCCIEAQKRLAEQKERKRMGAKKEPKVQPTTNEKELKKYDKLFDRIVLSIQGGDVWACKNLLESLFVHEKAIDTKEVKNRTALLIVDCIKACIDWVSEKLDTEMKKPATTYLDRLNKMREWLSQYEDFANEKTDIDQRMEALKAKYAEIRQLIELRQQTEDCRTQAEYLQMDVQNGRTDCAWTILESISLQLSKCASEMRLRSEVKDVLSMLLGMQTSLQEMKILH